MKDEDTRFSVEIGSLDHGERVTFIIGDGEKGIVMALPPNQMREIATSLLEACSIAEIEQMGHRPWEDKESHGETPDFH